MSDGSAELRFWDPETLKETGRITVTDDRARQGPERAGMGEGRDLCQCLADRPHRPHRSHDGKVTGWINLTGLLAPADHTGHTDVLNGIAYDAKGDRLFVTGKKWPKLFEIKLIRRSGGQ